MIGGTAMMTRKDSPFLNYWNNGFHQVVNTGTFKKICQEAVKKHGMCVFDIFYYNKYHIAIISIFILDIFFVATQFNHGILGHRGSVHCTGVVEEDVAPTNSTQ